MFGLVLTASVSTVDLTLKLQAYKHPPLATSLHPVGPHASTFHSSIGQNFALHHTREPEGLWRWNFVYKSAMKTVSWFVGWLAGFIKFLQSVVLVLVLVKFVVLNRARSRSVLFVSDVYEYMRRFQVASRRTLRRENQEGNT
jgi:hypothetical protein